jgi:eukaryotic-like serine/threonine-protein kinase
MQIPGQGDRLLGRQFGQFVLTRKLGEGGMGCVYLAVRTGEFEQTAAIKLLLDGRHHDGIMARFRAERQVMAALNHPGIVQLIDGGISDEGIPFLVMDYVEGVPLDEYCVARQLPVAEVVGLVIQILEAVEYAHRRFLAHCDLKFSNILVTAKGQPRLLDYSEARLHAAMARNPLETGGTVNLE